MSKNTLFLLLTLALLVIPGAGGTALGASRLDLLKQYSPVKVKLPARDLSVRPLPAGEKTPLPEGKPAPEVGEAVVESAQEEEPLSRLERIYLRYYQDIGGLQQRDPQEDLRRRFFTQEELENLPDSELRARAGDPWRQGRYDKQDQQEAIETWKLEQQWQKDLLSNFSQPGQAEGMLERSPPPWLPKEGGVEEKKGPIPAGEEEALRQFGYDFFRADMAEAVETLAVPDEDYVVGPGDRLLIRAWGAGVDLEVECPVANDGTISIPQLGVISVAGLEMGNLDRVITREAQKYVPGINLRVTLDGLKSLEIYFAGNVRQPGLHVLPAFSTLVTALIKAGGPTKDGSLRSIKLKRGGKEAVTLDAYDILLHGDRREDRYLQSGDLIFVPNIGRTVAVSGLVQKPGIFELDGEASWAAVAALAGGLLPQADKSHLAVKRFADHRIYTFKSVSLGEADGGSEGCRVENGDLLVAMPIVPLQKAIKVSGHVFEEQLIEYRPGLTLQDALADAELLRPGAMMKDGIVQRFDPVSSFYERIHFSPEAIFARTANMVLQESDEIVILSKKDFEIEEVVHIGGAVWKPGVYPFAPGMKLSDLMAMAGGLKKGAVLSEVELNRQSIENGLAVTTRQHVDWRSLRERDDDVSLAENDYVVVKEVKNFGAVSLVSISGEVAFPGNYVLQPGERLSDLLGRAGGFLGDAYLYGATFSRKSARAIQRQSFDNLINDLELQISRMSSESTQTALSPEEVTAAQVTLQAQRQFLQKLRTMPVTGRIVINLSNLATFAGSKYDFALDDGDAIHVPKKPDFVTVIGSVYSANSYFYDSKMGIEDYVAKAGGVTPEADNDRIYVLKANGEVLGKKNSDHSFLLSSFKNRPLMPGDTVVVPEQFDRVPYLRMIQDVSDIMFKIATTAGIAFAAGL